MKTELEKYLSHRNALLRSMDLDEAVRRSPHQSREVIEIGLHKARYECTSIEDDLRRASARWLHERGYQRIGGQPVDPDGPLPTGESV